MLTRNRLLAGTAALVALSLVGPAAAQAPIKIGELNSYKALPALMGLQYHFGQPGIVRPETFNHPIPQARMLLDQSPLIGAQTAGLRQ